MITLSYYPGCTLKSSGSFYDQSLRKVLSFYGVGLKELDDWSCCGASAAPTINEDLADVLSARNIAIAQREGFHLLAPCSACYARTKTTVSKIAANKDTREMVNRVLAPLSCSGSVEVKNIIEVFLEYVGIERIAAQTPYDLARIRAVPYYGCLLPRIMGVPSSDDVEDPTGMDILLEALGATVIPWQYKTECCGADSTATNSARTAEFSGRIMKAATSAGANAIVTTCPLCQVNLDLVAHLEKNIAAIPVFFLTEIFEFSLFGTVAGGSRHIIPITGIEQSVGAQGGSVP